MFVSMVNSMLSFISIIWSVDVPKALSPICVTWEGIQKLLIDVFKKASFSMISSSEFFGILIFLRFLQNEKAFSQICLRLDGRIISSIDVWENACFSMIWSSELSELTIVIDFNFLHE